MDSGAVGPTAPDAAVTGQETTVVGILEALLVHGMMVQGVPSGHHYGSVAVGGVEEEAERNCKIFAERYAESIEELT